MKKIGLLLVLLMGMVSPLFSVTASVELEEYRFIEGLASVLLPKGMVPSDGKGVALYSNNTLVKTTLLENKEQKVGFAIGYAELKSSGLSVELYKDTMKMVFKLMRPLVKLKKSGIRTFDDKEIGFLEMQIKDTTGAKNNVVFFFSKSEDKMLIAVFSYDDSVRKIWKKQTSKIINSLTILK